VNAHSKAIQTGKNCMISNKLMTHTLYYIASLMHTYSQISVPSSLFAGFFALKFLDITWICIYQQHASITKPIKKLQANLEWRCWWCSHVLSLVSGMLKLLSK
jgi:hypothetical protein